MFVLLTSIWAGKANISSKPPKTKKIKLSFFISLFTTASNFHLLNHAFLCLLLAQPLSTSKSLNCCSLLRLLEELLEFSSDDLNANFRCLLPSWTLLVFILSSNFWRLIRSFLIGAYIALVIASSKDRELRRDDFDIESSEQLELDEASINDCVMLLAISFSICFLWQNGSCHVLTKLVTIVLIWARWALIYLGKQLNLLFSSMSTSVQF